MKTATWIGKKNNNTPDYVDLCCFHVLSPVFVYLIISTPTTSIRSLLWLISVVSCPFLHPYLILTFPLIVCKIHQHIFSSVEHCIYPKYMLVVVGRTQRFININLLTLEFFLPFLTLLAHKVSFYCEALQSHLCDYKPSQFTTMFAGVYMTVNCMEIAFFH